MSNQTRKYTPVDRLCLGFDQLLRTVSGHTPLNRPTPAKSAPAWLNEKQRTHAAALMRVNHTGEVCAQALYQGQACATQDQCIKDQMQHAAQEETDHLAWCSLRIQELGSHVSYLNPLWYAGSWMIGLTAGLIGDSYSLGFVAETEKQVTDHLEKHLKILPAEDERSREILRQMHKEEAEHAVQATKAGGVDLPHFIKKIMRMTAKIMVRTAYWI